jgi:hypothetical protein
MESIIPTKIDIKKIELIESIIQKFNTDHPEYKIFHTGDFEFTLYKNREDIHYKYPMIVFDMYSVTMQYAVDISQELLHIFHNECIDYMYNYFTLISNKRYNKKVLPLKLHYVKYGIPQQYEGNSKYWSKMGY